MPHALFTQCSYYQIIEQYKISSTDVESLMKWKHTQY